MMTELRWFLIIIGVVIVIAVYAYSRYQSHAKGEKEFFRKPPPNDPLATDSEAENTDIPALSAEYSTDKLDNGALPETTLSAANKRDDLEDSEIVQLPETSSERKETTLVILHVWASPGQYWQGDRLMEVATKAGLTATNKNIFQYFHQNNSTLPLFHVANKTEPGTFQWDRMEQFKTQGVSLFMELPIFFSAYDAFLLMHACAQRFADMLTGEILDQNYKPLKQKTIDEIHQLCRAIDDEHNSI